MNRSPHDFSAEAPVLEKRSLGFVVASLVVAALLAALDQTIFGTALPTIVGDLHGVDQMLWVTTAYILAATIMMPVYGKLGDLFGHKVLFFSGLALFLGGSVLGGLAHNMPMLIAARGIQGLGGGGLMILSMSIIADIVPPRRRGTYMGIMGGAWAFSSVLGPILGGWFADSIGWRWAFWFNLPLGAFAIVMAAVFLKMPAQKKARPKLDGLGMVTMALATTAHHPGHLLGRARVRVEFAPHPGAHRRGRGHRRAVRAGGAQGGGADHPAAPCSATATSTWPPSAGLFSSIAFFGVLIYIPTYLQMVTGLTATKSGLLLVPLSAGILSTSLGSGALASRTGRYKWMPLASMSLFSA